LKCERYHYFKTRYDKNTSFGLTSYEGLKGTVKHEIIQEIFTYGESKGSYNVQGLRSDQTIINNSFNHRKLIDQIMLNHYDDIINFSSEELNNLNLEANKICIIAFNFKRKYLDNREPILCTMKCVF
jgi:hypothetical protein